MKAVPTITYVNNAYDDLFLRVARVFGKTFEKNGYKWAKCQSAWKFFRKTSYYSVEGKLPTRNKAMQ